MSSDFTFHYYSLHDLGILLASFPAYVKAARLSYGYIHGYVLEQKSF